MATNHARAKKRWHLDLDEALRLIEKREGGPVEVSASMGSEPSSRFIQKIIDKLCYLSMTDGLTGLPNRLYFMDQLKKEIERARRAKRPCSLVLLDLDGFKGINDSLGHVVGDYTLICVARILTKSLRLTDIVARYGGDEFALILPETNAFQAYAMTDRIREAIFGCEINYKGKKAKISVSAGIAVFQDERAMGEDRFIEMADEALLEAKRSGRNMVCFLKKELSLKSDTSLTLEEKDALLS